MGIPVNVTPFCKYKVGCVTPFNEYLLPSAVATSVKDCNIVVVDTTAVELLRSNRLPSPLISNKELCGINDNVSTTLLVAFVIVVGVVAL